MENLPCIEIDRRYHCDKPNCLYCKVMHTKQRFLPGIVRMKTLTDEQKEFLKANYNSMSMMQLTAELDISKTLLQSKAKELNLGDKRKIRVPGIKIPTQRLLAENFRGWF